MRDLEIIKRWTKESVVLDHYDLLYTHQLMMSGDKEAVRVAIENQVLRAVTLERESGELPSYPEIMPGMGRIGIQNHGLINARINVQGLAMDPEINFDHPDRIVREYNAAYIRDRWTTQRWSDVFYMTGLEVEANGMSSCHAGLSDGRVTWRHVSNMDVIWDRAHKDPANWRWVCVRNRLTPEDAEAIYGDALDTEEFEKLVEEDWRDGDERDMDNLRRTLPKMVIEWSYFDKDCHVVFLGSIHGNNSVALKLNSQYEYVKAGTTGGPNPFGTIPHAWWIDSWSPGVLRPVSKMDTTYHINAMLNEVEEFLIQSMRHGVPVTAVDAAKVDKSMVDEIREAKGVDALKKLILTNGGSIKDVLSRTDPIEIPPVVLSLYTILSNERNAATGVQDMQRGQALSGERTREEIRTLSDQSGVQARHMRRSFANFVNDVVQITRAIGAQHDRADSTLVLPTYGRFKTSEYPVAPFLAADIPVQVNPNSLIFKTETDRQNEAIAEFKTLHEPFIQLGVMSPAKSFETIMSRFGYQDPMKELGFTPQELAQQAAMQQSQVAEQQPTA